MIMYVTGTILVLSTEQDMGEVQYFNTFRSQTFAIVRFGLEVNLSTITYAFNRPSTHEMVDFGMIYGLYSVLQAKDTTSGSLINVIFFTLLLF